MSKSDAGKGDSPRPMQISRKQYAENHDRIFGDPLISIFEDVTFKSKKETTQTTNQEK